MKRYLVLLLSCLSAHCATITITCTNSSGVADTNIVRVYPVSTPIVNGNWTITGIPVRATPNPANGVTILTNQMKGNYYASNAVLQMYYAVPDSQSTYAAESLRVSGGNFYNYVPALTPEAIANSGVVTNGQLTVLSNKMLAQISEVASGVYVFDESNVTFTISSADLPVSRVEHSQYGIDTLRTLMQSVTNYTFRSPLPDTNTVDMDLINAIRTQGSNNCIVLTNGVYYIGTNAVLMSKGSVVLGQNMSNVVIYGRGPAPDNSSGVLRINDGCTVANLTGATIPSLAKPYNYTKAFEFFGGGYGNAVTNTAYLINTLSFSDSDTIRGGGNVQVVNSCVFGKWDGFFLEALTVTNRALIYNCYGFADDSSLNPNILLADVHALRLAGLIVEVWYSDFVATDNILGNGSVAAAVETPCTALFYECSFTCGTNGAANDGDYDLEIGANAYCTLIGGSYDPSKISNHGHLTIIPSRQDGIGLTTNTPSGALLSAVVTKGRVVASGASFNAASLTNIDGTKIRSGTLSATGLVSRAVHPIGSFNGVVIEATKAAQYFVTNRSFAVSGFSGVNAQHLFAMCVSNSASTSITWTGPPGAHYLANGIATNAMVIPPGQEMIVSFWIRPGRTNYANCLAP